MSPLNDIEILNVRDEIMSVERTENEPKLNNIVTYYPEKVSLVEGVVYIGSYLQCLERASQSLSRGLQ
jgi:hypothetical protein